jgi:hypothetical protein
LFEIWVRKTAERKGKEQISTAVTASWQKALFAEVAMKKYENVRFSSVCHSNAAVLRAVGGKLRNWRRVLLFE